MIRQCYHLIQHLFVDKNLVENFSGSDLLTRIGIQYHWQNNGYDCFDDFLARLNSRNRKMIKKERSAITKNLITIKVAYKTDITESNVKLHQYGLSSHQHTAEQGMNDTHLNHVIGDTEPREGDIECRSLDSFNLTEIDYVKIDVDGFEVPVLEGARKTLTNNDPVINIEMKRAKRPVITRTATKILNDLGYEYVKTTKSDEIWIKS